MGCHFLLQGIFLSKGWNLRLPHWQAGSSLLSHQGSPPEKVDIDKKGPCRKSVSATLTRTSKPHASNNTLCTVACDSVGQPGDPDQAWLISAGFIRHLWSVGGLAGWPAWAGQQGRLGHRSLHIQQACSRGTGARHPFPHWVGHSKSQGELRFQARGRSCRLTSKMGKGMVGVKHWHYFYISLTHTHTKETKVESPALST